MEPILRTKNLTKVYKVDQVETPALENAAFVLELQGVGRKERERRAMAALGELGIAESAYLALPQSGKGRAVLVLPSWWGLNDFFRGLCDRLSVEGFVALAADWYQGQVATTITEAKKLRNIKRKEPIYKGLIRAIEYLQKHPAVDGSSIAVIGFSMGAHWAFWLAARPELPIAATVAFYGARACDFSQSHSVFQCHFAQQDEWVSDSSVKKLKKNLQTAGKTLEFHTYPSTAHWFFEQDRPEYQPQATRLAWKRMIGFLEQHLVGQ